jgi:CubicO group peptidase (beta-lactamase class C family)
MNALLALAALLFALLFAGALLLRRFLPEPRAVRLAILFGIALLGTAAVLFPWVNIRVLPADRPAVVGNPDGKALPAKLRAVVDEAAGAFVAGGNTVGLAVGIFRQGTPHTFGYGLRDLNRDTPVDGDTVFEIGSITKTFTATLLADLAREGLVSLDMPVQECLPPGVTVPTRGGKPITLAQLAAHTSGLPRMPDNIQSPFFAYAEATGENPYARYTMAELYTFLGGCALQSVPGERFEYSNLGAALLGHALANRAGMGYEELVLSRVCRPLGMADTSLSPDPERMERLAKPYSRSLRRGPFQIALPAAHWTTEPFAPAGMLRSSAKDMLKYLAANLGARAAAAGAESPNRSLCAAMDAAHAVRHAVGPGMDIALGWHVLHLPTGSEPGYWHNGQTGGHRSFAGFLREAQVAVVVLSNSTGDVDDLGFRILAAAAKPD